MKLKLIATTALLAVAALQTGCATIIKGDQQPLSVNSNVEGAELFLDGAKIGETPYIGTVERKKEMAILEVKKDGYSSKRVVLDSTIEPVFWVNIISGGVFGSTTDYVSESMFKFAPATLNVDLEKESASAESTEEEKGSGKK